ncbi:PH domain-containing protein [Flavobacterium sp. NST-5]|uniref:PH domain-containing protein n=1 Tax=Flavobacterium ichthyis TaxID=2698827 RepID=A0ABW9Z933_9FLAO|nr:PH domain-containing protein [Flavobacterium ichthyis]NBL64309.1 PH domain-containing protein [Flavobacterium ichthyis]
MMEEFSNETLYLNNLPKFEEVVYSKLDPAYQKVARINLAIFLVILAGVVVGLFFLDEFFQNQTFIIITACSWLGLGIFLLIWYTIAIKNRGFAVREKDILCQRGVLSTTTTIIPYNRIQHVALHEGAIARIFKLAQIQIFTAGGTSSDLKISGLAKEEAEKIKSLLMQQIQYHA